MTDPNIIALVTRAIDRVDAAVSISIAAGITTPPQKTANRAGKLEARLIDIRTEKKRKIESVNTESTNKESTNKESTNKESTNKENKEPTNIESTYPVCSKTTISDVGDGVDEIEIDPKFLGDEIEIDPKFLGDEIEIDPKFLDDEIENEKFR